MSIIARKIGGINIPEAFKLLHMDKRFYGEPAGIVSYIYPGCGYGGYCLPKDTQAISSVSKQYGFKPSLIDANLEINENIMGFLLEEFFKLNYDKSVPIGILGLSFKPESDDVRSTPAIKCIQHLVNNGYTNIIVYDPKAIENFKKNYHELNVKYALSAKDLVDNVKIVFIITAWKDFLKLDFTGKKVFDLRYMLNHTE
jgi:UDPglucose 6-dehydrogenase